MTPVLTIAIIAVVAAACALCCSARTARRQRAHEREVDKRVRAHETALLVATDADAEVPQQPPRRRLRAVPDPKVILAAVGAATAAALSGMRKAQTPILASASAAVIAGSGAVLLMPDKGPIDSAQTPPPRAIRPLPPDLPDQDVSMPDPEPQSESTPLRKPEPTLTPDPTSEPSAPPEPSEPPSPSTSPSVPPSTPPSSPEPPREPGPPSSAPPEHAGEPGPPDVPPSTTPDTPEPEPEPDVDLPDVDEPERDRCLDLVVVELCVSSLGR